MGINSSEGQYRKELVDVEECFIEGVTDGR